MVTSKSKNSSLAFELVSMLQHQFVLDLGKLCSEDSHHALFKVSSWGRDQGRHGGGKRYEALDKDIFNSANVNVSQVQYEDDPDKSLGAATALSTIIHPQNPYAPSLHLHVSYTEFKNGKNYWRLMADLNPSLKTYDVSQKSRFLASLLKVTGANYKTGLSSGDQYFFIDSLCRHRGVAHFYLEEYETGNFVLDFEFAKAFSLEIISTYSQILKDVLLSQQRVSDDDLMEQLAYHTLYFFQVLTLDRGTVSGILVHDENDLGILGSLPTYIDRSLLLSWLNKIPESQRPLLNSIIACLSEARKCLIDSATKLAIAKALRAFYKSFPSAMALLARGPVVPKTTLNHL